MVQGLEVERIKRSSTSQLASEAILDLIRQGVLCPGDPLASQRNLVVQMGLSRAALREALSAAFHLAIIKATHNTVLIDVVRPFIRLISRASDTIAAKAPAAREREHRVHAELYEPLAAGHVREARQRMRRHLALAREAILEAFPEHQGRSAGALFGRKEA